MNVQDVLDRVRVRHLMDADKIRYPDARLLILYQEAIAELRSQRPDLFIGTGYLLAHPPLAALTDAVTLDTRSVAKIEDYIGAMALVKEDQQQTQARAAALLALSGRK